MYSFKSSVIPMFFHSRFSTYVWAIVASLRSMKRTDCLRFITIGIQISVELGFGLHPPKKRNDNNGLLWNLVKPGMYQPAVKSSQLEGEIFFQLKISHNWRYTAVHMSKCWWTSVVVMWFFRPPSRDSRGKDAIYRYPGSPCYGLLRKRQNGGRPEAQEGPKDTTSWAGCGFLSTLFAKMANQPTPP